MSTEKNRTVIIRHHVSGTLGKQTCSELTQSVKHWEAQTLLSKVKIPLEKVYLLHEDAHLGTKTLYRVYYRYFKTGVISDL